MSVTSRFETLFAFGLFFLCILCLEARSVDNENQKQEKYLLNILRQRILRTLQSQNLPNYHDYQEESDFNSDKNLPLIPEGSVKHRAKRIGIAGHENIDLIINALNKGSRQRSPMLSMRGTFGKLRQMMRNAGR